MRRRTHDDMDTQLHAVRVCQRSPCWTRLDTHARRETPRWHLHRDESHQHSVKQTVRIAVPKAMATTVDVLSFTPATDQVIKRDPVVAYVLTLPAGGTRELRFDLKLSRRPDAETLNSWIAATEQLRISDDKESHTTTQAARLG